MGIEISGDLFTSNFNATASRAGTLLYYVENETERLSLIARSGDEAIENDTGRWFIFNQNKSEEGEWIERPMMDSDIDGGFY